MDQQVLALDVLAIPDRLVPAVIWQQVAFLVKAAFIEPEAFLEVAL